jgi:hypothetical protein
MSRRSARNHKNDGLRSRGHEPCQLDRTCLTPTPTDPFLDTRSTWEKARLGPTPTSSSSPSPPSPNTAPSTSPRTAIPPTHTACRTSPNRRCRASTRSSCPGRSGRSRTWCRSSRHTRPIRKRHGEHTRACSTVGCCRPPRPPACRLHNTRPAPSPRPPVRTRPAGSSSPRHTTPSRPTMRTFSTQSPRPRRPPPRSGRFPRKFRRKRHEADRTRPSSGKVRSCAPRSRTTLRPTKASTHRQPHCPSTHRPAATRRPAVRRRSGRRTSRRPERSFARLRGRRYTTRTASRPGSIPTPPCEPQSVPLTGVSCLAGYHHRSGRTSTGW